ATLDQMSNYVRRWPQGNIWYLYGSRFDEWIADVYGDGVWKQVAEDYGSQLIPWGVNRSIRRATGRTYAALYQGWVKSLELLYAEQMREVERRGLREGKRLTRHGQVVFAPRFVPRAARRTGGDEILYFRDDGDSRSGLYRLPLGKGGAPGDE